MIPLDLIVDFFCFFKAFSVTQNLFLSWKVRDIGLCLRLILAPAQCAIFPQKTVVQNLQFVPFYADTYVF